jgi:hypothetical protein|tara:strand:- start:413 stop:688 length:276 start_codon:yes stop_codon:yes gene_type:complete
MKYFIQKRISCINPIDCQHEMEDKLEKKFNCCLKSTSDTDCPHGFVSILHSIPHHKITVCFYEDVTKLNPANKGGIQKLNNIPSKSEVENV